MKSDCYFDECKDCVWKSHNNMLLGCLGSRIGLAWHRFLLEMPLINGLIDRHKFCHWFIKE